MTKAKIEKEADKYFKSICGGYNEEYERTGKRHYWVGFDIKNAYLAGAEPREKRIEELEEAKANLEYLLEGRDNEIDELKKENKVLEQNLEDTEILNNTYEKRFDDLKKENAELKKQLVMSNKVYNDNLDYSHHIEEQLTKAKVALRNVIDYLGQFCSDYPDCVIEAEQFLNEVEK